MSCSRLGSASALLAEIISKIRIDQEREQIEGIWSWSRHDRLGASISELIERLRDRGWRLTAQRRVVAEVLVGEHVHLSAEHIFQRAQRRLPEISLATVYNTLNELVAMGEVAEISAGDGPKRYDPNTTLPHHHLYCVSCGALRDVHPEGTELLSLSPREQHGFELLDMDIVFRGRCAECQQATPKGDARSIPVAMP